MKEQNYTKDFARKLSEEMGIEWDETATAPTLHGVEIKSVNLEGTETSVKCECGHYLTLVECVNLEGKTYYKLVCKNCGTVYVENEPGSGVWSKMV